MRRFALIVLLSVFASFLGVDGRQTVAPVHAAFQGGNGKLLVRHSVGNGQFQLASVEPDGSDFTVLGSGFEGSWSPDGRKIAFSTFENQAPPNHIFLMDADGSNVTALFPGVRPSWSPDGKRIAFVKLFGELGAGISTAKSDGTDVVQLTAVSQITLLYGTHKWSPDGSWILFVGQLPSTGGDGPDAGLTGRTAVQNSGASETWDLYTVPAAGGGLTRLTNTEAIERAPDWSPDGSRIVFSDVTLGYSLFVMAAGGGSATKVVDAQHSAQGAGPVWSPDGERIAYTEAIIGSPVTYASYVIDPNGGNKKALPLSDIILDWQPVPATKVEFTQAIQQLQAIDELQEDLKGDGAPPVPIIAGKPAAMRVLFDEVDTATTYKVEVTGEFTEDETVTLTPGCTQAQRRKQEAGCKSVDFYFTPPQGNWSVTLTVKDGGGGVVEDHEFKLTSGKSDAMVLKAVDVCHAQTGFLSPWTCQSANSLIGLASHLRKVAPTDSVTVLLGGNQVKRRASDFPTPEAWMAQVAANIEDQHTVFDSLAGALGFETYYFGLTDPAAGGYNGIANSIPGRGALSRAVTTALGQTTTHTTIAHETGHLLGLSHTGTNTPNAASAPGCWGAGGGPANWPFPDNQLHATSGSVEVGFDLAEQKVLPGDTNFEMMSYCAPRWISPHRYLEMLGPSGPLSLVRGAPLSVEPAGAAGAFWLASGAIDGGTVEFRPLMEFETEGPVDQGSGSYRVEVRDGTDGVLFSRAFTPIDSHPELGPGQVESEAPPVFSELIPVQTGAARIVITDDQDAEIGAITLGGAAPAVTITQAANDGQVVSLEWSVDDPDSAQHTYWVDYSPDGGETWQNQAMGLADATHALDAETLAGSDDAVVRVIAADGVNSGEAVSEPFVVAGKLPEGGIIAPNGGSFREGSLAWLQAAAWDVDDGTLDDGDVTWTSSRDGALGSGASLPVYDLSIGTHTITMTAKDSDDNSVTDSITVTVYDGPIIEGQVGLSGDVDCSGAVNSVDALKLLRQVAGLPVAQTQPCPVIGVGDPSVFGDINCDGNITAVDALFVLRFVAGMPVNLPQGCRPVGT